MPTITSRPKCELKHSRQADASAQHNTVSAKFNSPG
jgi:hypothetical protein